MFATESCDLQASNPGISRESGDHKATAVSFHTIYDICSTFIPQIYSILLSLLCLTKSALSFGLAVKSFQLIIIVLEVPVCLGPITRKTSNQRLRD